MNNNGILRKHWLHVALHFLMDAGLFLLAFVAAAFVRFRSEGSEALWIHWPYLLFGAITFSAVTYIAGLYSTHSSNRGIFERIVVLAGCVLFAMLVVIGTTYGSFARPLGRGVMFLGGAGAYLLGVVHHLFLLHTLRTSLERVAYIVTSAFDEAETRLFVDFSGKNLEFVGVIAGCGYEPKEASKVLGTIEHVADIVKRENVKRVLCTSKNLTNATLTRHFCQLRYSGVSVMPLIILCEEIQQYVPLELVTHEWLLNASGEPQLLYIKKVKRLFDILASAAGLILGAPLVLLGALAVKLTSRGPIFYRQLRSGRFGRPFRMTKLRTMRVDAEKDGAKWSEKDDPRITFVGRFLRRYRIDEIPQLWHVLCGHMSFVGPRPERPEMIAQLAKEMPYYEERLMVQPGLTGWAQVSYPYGATVLDARRKLEYDLYYMKHMSVFLDVFILLDTVRIVLSGGAQATIARTSSPSENILEWERLKAAETAPADSLKLETA
jgi:exopolysaccharide biosynthesis polyprenyl glycosylphosphotransferase